MYHEVIVLEPQPTIRRDEQIRVLEKLAETYLLYRAPDHLAYGRIHFDRDHPHIHLMISSNGVRSATRRRINKASFQAIQKDLESFAIERFPRLRMTTVYGNTDVSKARHATREVEMEKRTGVPSSKRQLADQVKRRMSNCHGLKDFNQKLSRLGYRVYQRGLVAGIEPLAMGRRHRFKSLGLDDAYRALSQNQNQRTRQDDPRAEQLARRKMQLEQVAEHLLTDFERDE